MRLLYDENLPPSLVRRLADLFPDSESVLRVQPRPTSDHLIWLYASHHQMSIISKDSDFVQLAIRHGHPPKAIWIRCGNVGVAEVEAFIRSHASRVLAFCTATEESLLVLP